MSSQDPTRSGAGKAGEGPDRTGRREREDQTGHDWADAAADARTTDDPRRITPHDRAGVPSTGDNR